jgi:hypothetical protein
MSEVRGSVTTQLRDSLVTVEQRPGSTIDKASVALDRIIAYWVLCSGPVLLYAAQNGASLTPRMEGMLGEVRRRVQALAGCFHMASRLSQGPEAAAVDWEVMGRLPVELVQSIATLAGLSLAATELVK